MMKDVFVFDIETDGLRAHSNFKCMAWREGMEGEVNYTTDLRTAMGALELAHKLGMYVCGHNVMTFDLPVLLYNTGMDTEHDVVLPEGETARYFNWCREWLPRLRVWDTLIWSHKMFPDRREHSMDSYSTVLFNEYGVAPKVDVEDWGTVDAGTLKERCVHDVEIQTHLTDWFVKRGAPETVPMHDLDMAFYPVVLHLMTTGIPWDNEEAEKTVARMKGRLEGPRALLSVLAPEVNFNSNKQIDEYLKRTYGEGLPRVRKKSAKTGKETNNPVFNKENHLEMARKFPILDYVVRTKKDANLMKFLDPEQKNNFSNFLAPSPFFETDCIYPSFRLYGTRTMRSQYSSPAISQFPKAIRRTAAAPPGFSLVGFDIVALEMSIIGYLFKKILDDGYIFDELEGGVSVKEITLEAFKEAMTDTNYREGETPESVAKTVNYSILFGIAPETLAKRLNCYADGKPNVPLIEECIERRFPGFKRLSLLIRQSMKGDGRTGTVQTIYDTQVVTEERKAFNTVVQSSGAEYSRLIGCVLYDEVKKTLGGFPWVWLHDEFQFAVPSGRADDIEGAIEGITQAVKDRMAEEPKVGFLTGVEGKSGDSWYHTH